MTIKILRMGHRPQRDQRITTHVGLVGRAFGADGMFLTSNDRKVKESIDDVSKRFGGKFTVEIDVNWHKTLKEWSGTIIHLTMYGERLKNKSSSLQSITDDILIVVGAEKVPGQVYNEADYNLSVTNQPHSEIAALSILLDRIHDGYQPNQDFDGEVKVIPSKNGKKVEYLD
ncbi:tRNA (cytidine(56)-2'-O)-methyltransferase [Methanonatronarchaeum sp. AMET-Sl]|uniref:tRNA (cytidine(56)-2'-O)-methyltransferase n=1 Tax=Methanonatronarchaeum sp. AMET-Sl TaxID=3037654 RepID=UPI00244E1BF4|nr:tRNA (cytidine(56)-2'-O)-methyltransferase [Methanonatronarchaeum sp. AMET-Sl]WGI18144.1 tRNA (cytidine(56)-2'-O)-methyltransferase [Methanonatronarchaeum sp. AMET-Sl]